MQVVNLIDEVNKNSELYVYKKIGLLNEHVLSVVQVENRTLDFHVHEHSDKLFYVIEGSFYLETEEQKMKVNALTKFLMIELSGTLNKENSGDLYED
ncbi:hypothetical protein BXY41_103154 [Lacrimispora xylanisolvens]|jgi:hypothetical protein|uniref:Cupin 2 conserved barrel domain-containing protein n=1 Tax=Lacrimispora xylanisolvens TaxID=384636 RepID=A0A2S6HVG9_9FIRM|nr:cupin [Hungatella xylanolytica]MBE5989195.1 cupin [Paenibacillaceae bacterium]PPK81944.1 hypothetical protein BXY41_103154 [Hungatella xylanolytica]